MLRLPGRISKEFPPDRRPVQAYASYPEIQYVAFHYRNPLTGRMPPELLP